MTRRAAKPRPIDTRPLCAVCRHWREGDACAHHACPGRLAARLGVAFALVLVLIAAWFSGLALAIISLWFAALAVLVWLRLRPVIDAMLTADLSHGDFEPLHTAAQYPAAEPSETRDCV